MTISIKQILNEAVSQFKPDERVHVGMGAASIPGQHQNAEFGTVVKTNGFGHTHVKTDSGKEHVFNADKSYRGSVMGGKHHVDSALSSIKVRPAAEHEAAKVALDKSNAEFKVKKDAEEKYKGEQIAQHDPIHKEIIKKLKEGSGDEHLKNLGATQHEFDRHNKHYGTTTESEIKDHPFKDLFHKITKNVSIRNASPEHTAEHGITHYGSVEYRYQHPGGGSNGHTAYDFNRHTDGHIEIRKPVHVGTSPFGGDSWERKTTHTIK